MTMPLSVDIGRAAALVALLLVGVGCAADITPPPTDTLEVVTRRNPWAAPPQKTAGVLGELSNPAVGKLFASPWPDLSKPAPAQNTGAQDAAVIVGLEKYAFVAPVPGARRNAEDWYVYFTKTRGVPAQNLILLRDNEATREKILSAIGQASGAVGKGGMLWFVFIGHGAPSKNGRDGVLVTVDAQQDTDNLYARSLTQSDALKALGTGKRPSVAVLDTCFSGRNATGDQLVKGLQPLVPRVASPKPARASVVLTAGKSDQFAGALPRDARPAFSYLLLGALRGWGDADQDGKVTVSEALAYTQGAMRATVRTRTQTPQAFGANLKRPLTEAAREAGPDLSAIVLGR